MAFPLIPLAVVVGVGFLISKSGSSSNSATLTKGGEASNPSNDVVITQDDLAKAMTGVPEPLRTTAINAISFGTKDQIPSLNALADALQKGGYADAAALIRRRVAQLQKL